MWEQEEYKKEGIDWTGVTFADNKPVLVSVMVQPPYRIKWSCVILFFGFCITIHGILGRELGVMTIERWM